MLIHGKLEKFGKRREVTVFVEILVDGGQVVRNRLRRKNIVSSVEEVVIDVGQIIANSGGRIGFSD